VSFAALPLEAAANGTRVVHMASPMDAVVEDVAGAAGSPRRPCCAPGSIYARLEAAPSLLGIGPRHVAACSHRQVCLSVSQSVCLPACLFDWLAVCLSALWPDNARQVWFYKAEPGMATATLLAAHEFDAPVVALALNSSHAVALTAEGVIQLSGDINETVPPMRWPWSQTQGSTTGSCDLDLHVMPTRFGGGGRMSMCTCIHQGGWHS
jgi:hypothetical protein